MRSISPADSEEFRSTCQADEKPFVDGLANGTIIEDNISLLLESLWIHCIRFAVCQES